MDIGTHHIHSIIAKSLTDHLDDHELKELNDWKLASDKNLQEYNDFVDLWIRSESLSLPFEINQHKAFKLIQKNTGLYSSRKRWINIAARIAAVLVLSIILSGVFNYLKKDQFGLFHSNSSIQPVIRKLKLPLEHRQKLNWLMVPLSF